jgi:SAM-dependent methyltransferase
LILEHKPLVRHSGENWTLSQFKDAALFYLDWWEYLTTEGYSLQDCHTSNILFDGGRPQFVDFCSIGPGEAATVSMAFLSQYFDNWIAPLALIKENQHQMFRELLLRRLSLKEVKPLCGETMVQELDDLFDRGADSFAAKDLIGFIKTMRNWIRTVDIRDSTYGWNNETYQRADLGESGPRNSKEEIVAGLMDRFNPGSFLDLGCNKGRFSLFALQRGAEVLALDMAESLLDKLYRYAKETGLPLLSLYWDLSRLAGFDKPAKTFDMVAYLALVHHLVFTAGMTVEQVVRQANSLCGSVLLFEYIKPDPDEPFVYNNYVPERHPDYSPEGFHALLGQRFDSVETYDISPTRKLFVASR